MASNTGYAGKPFADSGAYNGSTVCRPPWLNILRRPSAPWPCLRRNICATDPYFRVSVRPPRAPVEIARPGQLGRTLEHQCGPTCATYWGHRCRRAPLRAGTPKYGQKSTRAVHAKVRLHDPMEGGSDGKCRRRGGHYGHVWGRPGLKLCRVGVGGP